MVEKFMQAVYSFKVGKDTCSKEKYMARFARLVTEEDKPNQRRVVFFGKQKIELKNLQRQAGEPSLIFSGANVVQSYKNKNARS